MKTKKKIKKKSSETAKQTRAQQRHHKAVQTVMARLDVDEQAAEKTIARLHTLSSIATIDAYVRDLPARDLAGHHREATATAAAPAAASTSRRTGKGWTNYDDQSRYDKPLHRTGSSWSGPHLNHTDPHAFDGYMPHAVENVDDPAPSLP